MKKNNGAYGAKIWCFSLFSAFFLYTGTVSSQPTFSKRLHFGFPAAVLTSVVPVDSGYMATGIIADSIAPFNTGNIFAFFDVTGELVWGKTVTDSLQTFETWHRTLKPWRDNTWGNIGYSSGSENYGLAIQYSNQGDTIRTTKYNSFFSPTENTVLPKDMVVTADTGFLIANLVVNPSGGNSGNADISLIKISSDFNIQWHKAYGSQNRRDWVYSLAGPDVNGKYLVGAFKDNRHLVNENYIHRTWIYQIDSLGNVEWEYLSPPNRLEYGAGDLYRNPDGSILIASAIGAEIDHPSVSDSRFGSKHFLIRSAGGARYW